jgi:nucleoside-diphosphate-sugar epimerase
VGRTWLSQGHRVTGFTRRSTNAEELRRDGIEPIIADVLEPKSLLCLPYADTVLYAIGLDRTSGASMRSVYVDGLANVLDHLPPPRRFIYVSSSSVYGQSDRSWVDEDSPTEPLEESGQVVLDAERLLRAGLPQAIILRFAGIYGPNRLLRQRIIEAGEPIVGDADKWLNLIHVEDGVQAVLAAEDRGVPGRSYNICDDQPVRRRDFYTELARCLSAPSPRFILPPPDQPTPPHEKANRRIRNRRMHEELGVQLCYASYREGLPNSLD